MVKVRLRTKFLLSLVFTTAALTCAVLLIVQIHLSNHARQQIHEGLKSSVITFQSFERQRRQTLSASARLLADLPSLKALMTTQHQLTIQDASTDFWKLAGSSLFLLADRTGTVMALHTEPAGFDQGVAQALLAETLQKGRNRDWWFGNGRLYEVFLQPIYFGTPSNNTLLGILAMGFEIDSSVAAEVARIASSEVAFYHGNDIVVSTLTPNQQGELSRQDKTIQSGSAINSQEIELGGERFLLESLDLAPQGGDPVSLKVLKSYDAATLFLRDLNRLLLAVGIIAVLAGGGLILFIADTLTRPLSSLVSGVRALGHGNFNYPLEIRTHDELAEVATAFDQMRKSLRQSQQELLHAERLATIGRMASSISHDLRHPLTTILAYAELLGEGNLAQPERKEFYQEICLSVNKMTELISSLLEFSKAQEGVNLVYGEVVEVIQHAIDGLRLRPEFRPITITLSHDGSTHGWFDLKKLDRVFYNLLLNACEAVPSGSGKIEVSARRMDSQVEIRIADNGPGIPGSIRDKIFHPFVSHGKDGGTGLGLAVVHKIVHDHGGDVTIESNTGSGAIFKVTLPIVVPSDQLPSA